VLTYSIWGAQAFLRCCSTAHSDMSLLSLYLAVVQWKTSSSSGCRSKYSFSASRMLTTIRTKVCDPTENAPDFLAKRECPPIHSASSSIVRCAALSPYRSRLRLVPQTTSVDWVRRTARISLAAQMVFGLFSLTGFAKLGDSNDLLITVLILDVCVQLVEFMFYFVCRVQGV
jgi:hypothetical protein